MTNLEIALYRNVTGCCRIRRNGKVYFVLGIVAAIFSILGHYIGSGLVIKNGAKIVRPIIIVVLIMLFVKVIIGV